jgi:hypothetical protein
MALVDRLLDQLKDRGIQVVYVDADSLKLTGNTKDATPQLIAAVKEFKPELLAVYKPKDEIEKCSKCGAAAMKYYDGAGCEHGNLCPYGKRS